MKPLALPTILAACLSLPGIADAAVVQVLAALTAA